VVTQWEIPVFVAQTGVVAFLGEDVQWAMNRAVAEVNAAGGVRGKPMKLTYYDSPYDAARAVTLTREQADKALVIAAQVTGVEAEAAAPIAVSSKVPWIDAITNASTTFEKNRPWTFGLSTDPGSSAGAALKKLLADNPNVKTYGRKDASGYMRYSKLAVHRLVASLFCDGELSADSVVNHKDSNRSNNKAENLEICSSSWNSRHRYMEMKDYDNFFICHQQGR